MKKGFSYFPQNFKLHDQQAKKTIFCMYLLLFGLVMFKFSFVWPHWAFLNIQLRLSYIFLGIRNHRYVFPHWKNTWFRINNKHSKKFNHPYIENFKAFASDKLFTKMGEYCVRCTSSLPTGYGSSFSAPCRRDITECLGRMAIICAGSGHWGGVSRC